MATLVLTAVGSALGGPLGGAIGAALGQQVDNALFAPKARESARLKELQVQLSSYGSQIPACFGTMRVAGTVIWSTDLIERKAKSGGGKGRPATVSFSYSVSIAVALSSRPVTRIGRIWADGNLLRGAAGDLKVDTQLRLYTGHEDQALDPLMASAEGIDQCPAYRGLAYAIFEDLQLADYGNRIPSLTFELFEREETVPVAEIFHVATGGIVKGESERTVSGFALAGATAREPLSLLNDIFSLECRMQEDELRIGDRLRAVGNLPALAGLRSENSEIFEYPRRNIGSASRTPHVLTLRYYDRSRDFQTSLQRIARGPVSRVEHTVELPAVLEAEMAKNVVEDRLMDMQTQRHSWRGDVAVDQERRYPGDLFSDTSGQIWRIEQIEQRFGSAHIIAQPFRPSLDLSVYSAWPGRNLSSPDMTIGETRLVVVELPVSGLSDPGKPIVAIFAAGTAAGWRRAALSLGPVDALTDIGTTAQPAVMGSLLDPLLPHTPYLIDERYGVRVQLLHAGMSIANRAGSPLDIDAPLFWLSGEFVRVGSCDDLGNGIYRFSKLLRGCFGLEDTVVPHNAGAPFVLMEPDSARMIEERIPAKDEVVQVEALGLGDRVPVASSVQIRALAITPLFPVHGKSLHAENGDILLRWVRRSRIDNGWKDEVDQLMVEESERYRVTVFAGDRLVGEWITDAPHFTLSAGKISDLGLANAAIIKAEIRQIGRHAHSAPLTITI